MIDLSLNPQHVKRYGQMARLLVKYGRADLVKSSGLDTLLAEGGDAAPVDDGRELADDLELLGPTYVKLGQLLSTRPDMLPAGYTESLARLQDKVEPFPFADVERIVCRELGVRLPKAFDAFEPEPIAAASLGQVHRAVLRGGRAVAVKVQRPRIREQMAADLEALGEIAGLLDRFTEAGRRHDFTAMLEEFRRSLVRELDYTQEARHLEIIGHNLREFQQIVVPDPIRDYTSSRVLTMDYVRGRKITALSPLARMELNGEQLGTALFQAYLRQILVDGIFHADPHPGNVFITDDNRLALIDLGMVGRIAPVMQDKLLKLLLAISEGKGEDAARVAIDIGDHRPDFDEKLYVREVSQLVALHQDATLAQIDTGRVILELIRQAGVTGLRLPVELTLLGKTLLNLDLVATVLAPEADFNEIIRDNASDILRKRLVKSASPTNVFSTVLEMNEFVQRLPGRLNRVLDKVAENELSLRINAFDEVQLMQGMQKIANRITLGLVLAALIVGAAMLMRVETSFRIFGYPGLAMLLFLGAVIGGILLAYNIVFRDTHR